MEKARPRAQNLLGVIARWLARLVPNPDFYTLLGGVLAWTVPLLAYMHHYLAASLMILASALVDALDGSVARITRGASRYGEFLDSVTDRLSDLAYFLAIYLAGLPPAPVVLGVGLAVTISYVRAKGELVGVQLRGVGLMERGDRTITLFIIALLAALGNTYWAGMLLWLMVALMAYTVAERSYRVLSSLKEG